MWVNCIKLNIFYLLNQGKWVATSDKNREYISGIPNIFVFIRDIPGFLNTRDLLNNRKLGFLFSTLTGLVREGSSESAVGKSFYY
jgi:hypothetical protein